MDALKLITAGKSALDGIKLLNQYAEEIKDTQKRGEFMRIIGQLSIELAETQMKLAEQIQDSIENKQKIKVLEDEIEQLKNPNVKVIWKNGLYYKENGDGGYCTGCYDNNKKLIRVTEPLPGFKLYQCPVCQSTYK
ncbi:hypothetical protein [Nostoc sp. DedQUE07]|uniref:hypothetical protein n=1 Tax=Nostoc sp. DedQUE07 TaxID=3075392 RepID=UPI002AD2A4AB|nr:hypothetical protein [Nostoc sp. DedQUE07]MDZ8131975.1 hypothetical protein [Nostoc sp. DedQUE07]